MKCDHCGREIEALGHTCRRCDGTFCTQCRLPESHDCVALKIKKAEQQLKHEADQVEPWFKDDFRLSNVDASDPADQSRKQPDDEKKEPIAECERCGTPLRDHEIAGCPHCDEVYCGEHIGGHRSKCFDPPTAGASTDQTDKAPDTKSENAESEERKRRTVDRPAKDESESHGDTLDNVHEDKKRGENLREAAKEAENKRYPNTEGSPDVAPDGSINHHSVNKSKKPRNESTDSSGFSDAFSLVLDVPMWLVSSVAGFAKHVFRYPVDSVWKVTKLALIVGAVLLVAGQIGVGPVGSSPGEIVSPLVDAASNATEPRQLDEQKVERLVREGINEKRAERGLAGLSSLASLQERARLHSVDMVEHDELAHDLPGSTTDERLEMANCDIGGENVAQSWYQERVETSEGEVYIGDEETLAEELVAQWMNSPGHRENLLRQEWSQTGIGIELTEDDKIYATQKFCA
ncbi:CAP domain-containing protein [Halorubrum sp. DTA46]|uniref:CAP domain-containing protein n=1 Tax=Halorubrum sp. DTA46 TaxID=3402162 RepID=UPI003AB0B33F